MLKPEPGRDACRDAEYVRTTTGWLVTVVRLEVDFADLLLEGDEWKAGAFRARNAADWVGGIVLVRVVVALGTEPELAVRSEVPSGASSGCVWARTGSLDSIGWALSVDVVLLPKRVEKTPKGTDCLAVAVGVNGCGIEFDSAVPEPCCSQSVGGAALCGSRGAWKGTRGSLDMPAIVVGSGSVAAGQCIAAMRRRLSCWVSCRDREGCVGGRRGLRLAKHFGLPPTRPPSLGRRHTIAHTPRHVNCVALQLPCPQLRTSKAHISFAVAKMRHIGCDCPNCF